MLNEMLSLFIFTLACLAAGDEACCNSVTCLEIDSSTFWPFLIIPQISTTSSTSKGERRIIRCQMRRESPSQVSFFLPTLYGRIYLSANLPTLLYLGTFPAAFVSSLSLLPFPLSFFTRVVSIHFPSCPPPGYLLETFFSLLTL